MKLFTLLLMLVAALNVAAESTLPMGEFSRNSLNGWEQKSFTGETRYQLQTVDDVVVLRADSHEAGSGLFKE